MANETLGDHEDGATTEAVSQVCHAQVPEEEGEEEEQTREKKEQAPVRPIGPDPGFFWDEKDDPTLNPVTDTQPTQACKSVFNVDIPKPYQFTVRKRQIKENKRKALPAAQSPLSLFTSAVFASACVSTLQGTSSQISPQVAAESAVTTRPPPQDKKTAHYGRRKKGSLGGSRSSRVSWSIDSASSLGDETMSSRMRPERKSLPARTLSYCRAIQEITPSNVPDFRRFLCRCPWLRLPCPPPCPQDSDDAILDIWTTVVDLKLDAERTWREEQEKAHLREDMEVRSKFLYQGVGLCAYVRTRPQSLYWPM